MRIRYRVRRSGNTRAERGRREHMRENWMRWGGLVRTADRRRTRLAGSERMGGGSTTCTGTYGSGVAIGMGTILQAVCRTQPVLVRAPAGSAGGAVGLTPPPTRVRRIASGIRPVIVTASSASASPSVQSARRGELKNGEVSEGGVKQAGQAERARPAQRAGAHAAAVGGANFPI